MGPNLQDISYDFASKAQGEHQGECREGHEPWPANGSFPRAPTRQLERTLTPRKTCNAPVLSALCSPLIVLGGSARRHIARLAQVILLQELARQWPCLSRLRRAGRLQSGSETAAQLVLHNSNSQQSTNSAARPQPPQIPATRSTPQPQPLLVPA